MHEEFVTENFIPVKALEILTFSCVIVTIELASRIRGYE